MTLGIRESCPHFPYHAFFLLMKPFLSFQIALEQLGCHSQAQSKSLLPPHRCPQLLLSPPQPVSLVLFRFLAPSHLSILIAQATVPHPTSTLEKKKKGSTLKIKVSRALTTRMTQKTAVPLEVPGSSETLPEGQDSPSPSSLQPLKSSKKCPGSAVIEPQAKKVKRRPSKMSRKILSSDESSPESLQEPIPDPAPKEPNHQDLTPGDNKMDKGKGKTKEKEENPPTESVKGDSQPVKKIYLTVASSNADQ